MTLKTSLVIGGDAQDAIAALIGFEQRLAKAETAARKLASANDDVGTKADKGSRQAQAGYVNLGRQVQDVAVQLQGGANIGTIVAQQGGQIADAVAQMGGRFKGLAGFIAGPFGALLTVGIGVAINLADSLWKSAAAADANADALSKVQLASDGLASAQSVLAQVFDLTTGKMKSQNKELLFNIQLQALKLKGEAASAQKDADKAIGDAGSLSTFSLERGFGGMPVINRDLKRSNAAERLLLGVKSGKIDPVTASQQGDKLNLDGTGIDQAGFQKAIRDLLTAQSTSSTADKLLATLRTKTVDPSFLKPKADKKPKKVADKSAREREFAEDTAAKIAGIKDEFSDLPSAVEKSNAALRKLNDIASDIEGKKGPNYDKMRGDIAGAKDAIQSSLTRPFNDYLEKAREGEQIDRLLVQGKEDQADALQVILGLEERMGPLTDAQLQNVLATVEADRRRSAVLRDQREIISAQVDAVYDMRGALQQTVADAIRGRFSFGNILSSAANSYVDILSKKTVEALFGDTLRKLEEEASGQSTLKKASDAMAGELAKTGTAAKDLATSFREAISTIKGTSPTPSTGSDAPADPDEIVVTGRRPAEVDGKTGNLMVSMADQLARQVGIKLPTPFVDAAKKMLGKLETGLPSILGTALVGASVGQAAFGNSKGAGLGGAIGGVVGKEVGKMAGKAIGGALGKLGGPIGSILGSVLGAGLGKLVSGVKTGTATVGNSSGRGQVTGTGGNSASRVSAARGLASGALSALDQIVAQLNGELGDFSGSIGIRNKKYVVDTTGAGKTKGAGVQKFATEAEAQQALLADMIADGAVKGVSSAVQRALSGSGDVEQRLKEALKVQDLELAIGGIGAALDKEFRTFERQAAERVRIAKQYGFDVIKVEEQNAKDRLKLSEKLLAEQIGSLQDLINDMTSGSLFEGSSVDRRKLLLDQIAGARAQVDAGTEGAADKLANLLDQLNSVSKEAFATTGTFAADRASILDEARGAIAKANERITAAQSASDPALSTTNAALDENNAQNAQMIAALGLNNALLQQFLKGGYLAGGGSGYLAALAGTSSK